MVKFSIEMCRRLSLLLVLCILFSVPSQTIGGVVQAISRGISAIKYPIYKSLLYIGSKGCEHVKRILGVAYDQYDVEPDFSMLTFQFITQDNELTFNLNELTSGIFLKYFKPEDGLVVLLHGYLNDPKESGSYKHISNALLQQGVGNILALDASSQIRYFYLRASTMVRFIGNKLGRLLADMILYVGLDPSTIHLVGHSLGAHIAGFIGQEVLLLTGSQVGRISGLDPAGPCFSNVDVSLKLNKDDAFYVDVIHTDAGVYGLNENVGHADYWPNRGNQQPDCLLETCCHSRAWQLYTESIISPNSFPAVNCKHWRAFKRGNCDYNDISLMGYDSKPGTLGQYYLQTSGSSPYGLEIDGVRHGRNIARKNLRNMFGISLRMGKGTRALTQRQMDDGSYCLKAVHTNVHI